MSTYRVEWPCCGSVTETQAWEPERCPFCEPDADAPDPALLALAKLGAMVVRETESPRYAHSFTWDESRVLDILAHEAGVRVHVSPADQVLASGIAAAIARLLAPDGAASEGVPG